MAKPKSMPSQRSEQDPRPRSKAEAVARGLKSYYTGKPCKQGHLSEQDLDYHCIQCRDEYAKRNMKKITARAMKWKKKNPQKVAESARKRNQKIKNDPVRHQHHISTRQRRREQRRLNGCRKEADYSMEWQRRHPDYQREYHKNNPHILRASKARRRALELNATPPWVDHEAMKVVYKECIRITKETGIRHEVDHVVPLSNKRVSGLHVVHNLQIIPFKENRNKSNRFIEALAIAPTRANGLLKDQ